MREGADKQQPPRLRVANARLEAVEIDSVGNRDGARDQPPVLLRHHHHAIDALPRVVFKVQPTFILAARLPNLPRAPASARTDRR